MTIDIRTVGIVGAGQMGNGIAHVCALAGIDVRLNDISEEKLNQALAEATAGQVYAEVMETRFMGRRVK